MTVGGSRTGSDVTHNTDDVASGLLPQPLLSSGRGCERGSRTACRPLVSEMYSRPRVAAKIKRGRHPHLVPGFAFDLTMVDPEDGRPWDPSQGATRTKARRMLDGQKPFLAIGSPHCTAFSTLQALTAAKSIDKDGVRRAPKPSIKHIEFVVGPNHAPTDTERYLLPQHPNYATSWGLGKIDVGRWRAAWARRSMPARGRDPARDSARKPNEQAERIPRERSEDRLCVSNRTRLPLHI